ncbi:TRAP transporter substrate-binding protein [Vreelandella aquamarina]|jgi:tripartite ATP-independent transporter DctP family solute receptor|uniref:Tripartite ATP-independent transporter solute receptor, DctP family n=1 Tax=Vreelandella aquamarina TaxID=77097 RepID=A0A1N6D9C8_9GAMM|nr:MULTISPECIES: TRAP transporter substrate-binding protein [Halomonas]GED45946.1 C4-dicarboxylate ABC transporter [Halomonas meridiana]SIN61742.1 tripartite ATP-independent transporter solute receptor, DctP family [Halomonas meridiana]SIN67421.1 tripartite ATP-independent transporter solute receptor, DctP family [Halomonas meridiana]SIN94540.1 tripartite ATP-independent transporter solute receptor, DctP family [Halomonas meridiana]|tara:strand:+ start:2592 stop:3572 length:981 start_codon:yes stop_codon:yes gene_type:complete
MKKTILASVIASAFFISGNAAAQQTLQLAHNAAEGNPKWDASELFAELVEEGTNGELIVDVGGNAQYGDDMEAITQMRMGTLAFSTNSQGSTSSVVPQFSVLGLPFLFNSLPSAWEVMDGEVGDELKRLSEEKGLVLLALWDNGIRHVSNNIRPIETPDDLEGLKIRTPPDEMTVDIFEALGSNPTPMNFSELYIALEQGVVDGQENPLMNIYSSKLHEVQDYISLTGHKYESTPLLMSKMVWDSLSPEYQEVIQQAAVEAGEFNRQASLEADEALRRDMEEAGVAFNEVDPAPFIEATSSVYDQWAEEYPELVDMVVKAAQRESQ